MNLGWDKIHYARKLFIKQTYNTLCTVFHNIGNDHPVLELLPLAVVSGGQVQIRWAGLAWRWPNAKPNLTSGTKLLVNIARNAKLSLPIMILPENAKPQESAHQESAHVYAVFVAKMAFARFDGQV